MEEFESSRRVREARGSRHYFPVRDFSDSMIVLFGHAFNVKR